MHNWVCYNQRIARQLRANFGRNLANRRWRSKRFAALNPLCTWDTYKARFLLSSQNLPLVEILHWVAYLTKKGTFNGAIGFQMIFHGNPFTRNGRLEYKGSKKIASCFGGGALHWEFGGLIFNLTVSGGTPSCRSNQGCWATLWFSGKPSWRKTGDQTLEFKPCAYS